jgi:hypothetical protein
VSAEAGAPKELLVDARPAPGDQASSSGMASLPFVAPAAVGGLLAKYVSPAMGLFGLAASILVVVLLRKPREGRFVLRVEGDVLEVRREKRADPVAQIALADVVDVTIDRQAHQGSARGGAAAERAHIALERRGEEPVHVPDERVTSIEAQEWHGKIRVFLRKHGWVPEDERATA